jgi:hypothetical protein
MKKHNNFSSWIARARGDQHPSPDVAARVMRTLTVSSQRETTGDWLPGWRFEVALVGLTLVLILFGAQAMQETADPLREYASMFMEW